MPNTIEKLNDTIRHLRYCSVDGDCFTCERWNKDCGSWNCVNELLKTAAELLESVANGVTVQECKVGDTIYEADGEHGVIKHEVYEVCVVFKTTATDDKGNEWDDYWTTDDIGNAYKTRNEAEAKLPQPPKGE